jgi:hypothetical protein
VFFDAYAAPVDASIEQIGKLGFDCLPMGRSGIVGDFSDGLLHGGQFIMNAIEMVGG